MLLCYKRETCEGEARRRTDWNKSFALGLAGGKLSSYRSAAKSQKGDQPNRLSWLDLVTRADLELTLRRSCEAGIGEKPLLGLVEC